MYLHMSLFFCTFAAHWYDYRNFERSKAQAQIKKINKISARLGKEIIKTKTQWQQQSNLTT